MIKEIIKQKFLPEIVKDLYKVILYRIINRPVNNYFKTNYDKVVLISYITHPFKKEISLSHTNQTEALEIARLFKELGFNVDIVRYDHDYGRLIDYSKYSVLFGFGTPFEKSFFYKKNEQIHIYYGTTMHPDFLNQASIKRIEEVYHKKGNLLVDSGRIIENTWPVQTAFSDYIITLGNEVTVDSYKKKFKNKIFNIPASYYNILNVNDIKRDYTQAKKNFLWFGGVGLIHKGLDLLLEIFKENPEINLHICGYFEEELRFQKCYQEELFKTPNIHLHGFVNLESEKFKAIINKCAFVVLPSCSEGCNTSLLNTIANGGLIPVATKEVGVDFKEFGIVIKSIEKNNIVESINAANNLTVDQIKEMSSTGQAFIQKNYSLEHYSKKLKDALCKILKCHR